MVHIREVIDMRYISKEEFLSVVDTINELQELKADTMKLNLEFTKEIIDDDGKTIRGGYYVYNDDCKKWIFGDNEKIRLCKFSIVSKNTGKMLMLIPLSDIGDCIDDIPYTLRYYVLNVKYCHI